MEVKRIERGWGGHFIGSDKCLFRRNTLISCRDANIVVSTIGMWLSNNIARTAYIYRPFADGHYYETKAFHSKASDTRYHDADIEREVYIESTNKLYYIADDDANNMHEMVVEELIIKLKEGVLSDES